MTKNNRIDNKFEELTEFLREPIFIQSFYFDIHDMGYDLILGFIDKNGKPKEFYFNEDELFPLFSMVLKNEDEMIRGRGYHILAEITEYMPEKIKMFEQIILDNYELDKNRFAIKLSYFTVLAYLKTDRSRDLLYKTYNSTKNKTDKTLMSFIMEDTMFVDKPITKEMRNLHVHQKEVKEDVESIKTTLEKQPESKVKKELTEKVQSLADKINQILNQDLDRMIKGQKPKIDIERLEKIAKIGRYESWWKRNLVPLIGSVLTFIVAFIAMVFSWYK